MESGSYDAQYEANLFSIFVLQAIMLPLTGFLNLCIYVRPRYLRCRSDFPLESRWWAVRRALYEEAVPPSAILALRATSKSTKGLAETTNSSIPEHRMDVEDATSKETMERVETQ